MCYDDTFRYGWPHVDLFVYDEYGREISWVHWATEGNGPGAADRATAVEEPSIRRLTEWERAVSASGGVYWTAEAVWTPWAPEKAVPPSSRAHPRIVSTGGHGHSTSEERP
ncbi:hypothetical protein Misp02_35350 [Microtetraspora sp. NBRC 16547]|nr:hypothetical protein Misp02_35350 [Microtetraspora sp. NBRC 16547]